MSASFRPTGVCLSLDRPKLTPDDIKNLEEAMKKAAAAKE